MKIRLDAARDEPFHWQESIAFPAAKFGLGSDLELSPVEVDGTLTWAAPNYLLQARLAYRRKVACDRCLAPVVEAVDQPFVVLVVPRAGREAGPQERELGADELGVLEVAGETLDTEPIVAEQVELDLPTHPLCREECAGLCPRCGRNLNEGACGCGPPATDPRWGALAALREKMDGRA
jgi:uncharacterized protein